MVAGVSTEVPYEGEPGSRLLVVRNFESGNAAVRKLSDVAKSGRWTVTAKDENRVGAVTVKVVDGDRAIERGMVSLANGDKQASVLLSPADDGSAKFYALEPGSYRVSFEYERDGVATVAPAETFNLSMQRATPETTWTLDVPGAASATAETPKSEPEPAPPVAQKEESTPRAPNTNAGPIPQFLSILISLAVVAGLAWLILNYVRNNQAKVQSALEQVGIKVPDPSAHQPEPPIAAPKPEPLQKIVLPDASPGPATATAAGMKVSNPRLVADDGSVFLIPEGESVVGRDATADLSLAGESTVSRRHAQLIREGDRVRIQDLGSTNGAYVNGAKVESSLELHDGDQVQFGAVRRRFEA